MENEKEPKPELEQVKKDYFKSLDNLVEQSSSMNTDPLEKMLGKYRNVVVLAALLVLGLVLTDHYLLAKLAGTVAVLIVVLHSIISVKAARSLANKGVEMGVKGTMSAVDKVKGMKKEKEVPKTVPEQTKE